MTSALAQPAPADAATIICIHCDRPQLVGRRALSLPCKHCHKPLRIENINFTAYEARRLIETCGAVIVEPKANVIADKIVCSSLIIRGRLRGNVHCHGRAILEPSAEFRGNLTAHSLVAEPGARLDGNYQVCPAPVSVGM